MTIYWGKAAAMRAELGTLECYEGRYLVQPVGGAEYDAEGFNTAKEARAHATYLAGVFSASVCKVA